MNSSPFKLSRSRRSGFTLRELTMAMAFGSMVMMSAVGLVHQAFDWSTAARHYRYDDQTFFRLSRQLRQDAVSATASVADDGTAVTFQHAGDVSVEYLIDGDAVHRRESRSDRVLRREAYTFQIDRRMTFHSIDADKQLRFDVKTVTPYPDDQTPLWRSVRLVPGLRLQHELGEVES